MDLTLRQRAIVDASAAADIVLRTGVANPIAEWTAHGHVENIRFASGFTAVNSALREQCRRFTRNNVVHAQHWRQSDGPRPTLCVIHGFMGSPYLANGTPGWTGSP